MSNQQSKTWNLLRKATVILVLTVYAATGIVVAMYGLGIHWWFINPPLKARTYQVATNINFQSNSMLASQSDMTLGLTFYYPDGVLIIGEPVNVTGVAVLKTAAAQTVGEITITFQTCLAYPPANDFDGIAIPGNLFLNVMNGNKITGQTQVYWPVDGDNTGSMMVFFNNGSPPQGMTLPSFIIHVYPQEQLTQLESTNVSVILTYAVFVLTLMGIISVGVELWPKKEAQNTDSTRDILFYRRLVQESR